MMKIFGKARKAKVGKGKSAVDSVDASNGCAGICVDPGEAKWVTEKGYINPPETTREPVVWYDKITRFSVEGSSGGFVSASARGSVERSKETGKLVYAYIDGELVLYGRRVGEYIRLYSYLSKGAEDRPVGEPDDIKELDKLITELTNYRDSLVAFTKME